MKESTILFFLFMSLSLSLSTISLSLSYSLILEFFSSLFSFGTHLNFVFLSLHFFSFVKNLKGLQFIASHPRPKQLFFQERKILCFFQLLWSTIFKTFKNLALPVRSSDAIRKAEFNFIGSILREKDNSLSTFTSSNLSGKTPLFFVARSLLTRSFHCNNCFHFEFQHEQYLRALSHKIKIFGQNLLIKTSF